MDGSGRLFKSADEGGRDIGSFEELIEAVQEWFGYDQLERSPFPSGEPTTEAAKKWFEQRLKVEVKGTNRFELSCPGCDRRIEAQTNCLHTLPMFDYEYWRFCPTCSTALDDDSEE
ncbi:MAG: hypothetical protein IIC82_03100 [Chloroflexi bacterium]|nr:hypothetical protein [Chloroflexota bacterium]